MNQIPRYPSGQDGAILPARDFSLCRCPCFIPCNKSLIDQACSVKMDGYWPRSFLACLWTSTSSRSINTQKKLGQYPAILTSYLVNNPYLLCLSLSTHAVIGQFCGPYSPTTISSLFIWDLPPPGVRPAVGL